MHIVLTHEQADFDALASLLGAHLLFEDALPVLPRRMNRNVHAFLALYGAELPFVDPRDLPPGPIEQVTLVDTQSLVSVKGVSQATRVQVIDHHPRRENLPGEWLVSGDELGANATLLVEALREHNGLLTGVQSTLLMLGIYEDTGSLTYTRTSARDLRAAAYLVEQGADLGIVSKFLNHPLSLAQQALYDSLRKNIEHYHIHGHTVVLASGDSQDVDEELSSITHKLRDLLEPDALFVLVTTRSGVQLIARSTSDSIDVAAVLANFGGGGHERAAACLIRSRDLDSVRAELVNLLPGYVRPALTVAQIMSRDPQLLPPSMPVEEVALRMRRYGYEGFPVVKDGKLVGLITRRAVDRALSHKLNLPASSLMDAGATTVFPDDSIDLVQRLVRETGWGQIPVVNHEDGRIIGIVTRTDLLKAMPSQPRRPGHINLAERLESALLPERLELLQAISEEAREQRDALYIVGGFVRDLLIDRPSLDFDLVVEGDAIRLAHSLARRYGGRVTSHSRFGTAKWRLDELPQDAPRMVWVAAGLKTIDLVTARTEFYAHPTALPTVERGSIKLDLHRRDFTINTLALRLDGRYYGELYDYWGGLSDLRAGLVRVLHSLSFVDDPTRILRAVRFEQRFSFRIEGRTLELLLEARPLIERLSGDRIRHELNLILATPVAAQILARLHSLGLLSVVQPALCWDDWLSARLQSLDSLAPGPDWELDLERDPALLKRDLVYIFWLLRVPVDQAQLITARLKLPVALEKAIMAAGGLWNELDLLAQLPVSQAAARLEQLPPLARYALYLATPNENVRSMLLRYASHWRKISSLVDGHTLKRLGLSPGPLYRQVLGALRAAWLDGEISTPLEEQALLESLLSAAEKAKQGGAGNAE